MWLGTDTEEICRRINKTTNGTRARERRDCTAMEDSKGGELLDERFEKDEKSAVSLSDRKQKKIERIQLKRHDNNEGKNFRGKDGR